MTKPENSPVVHGAGGGSRNSFDKFLMISKRPPIAEKTKTLGRKFVTRTIIPPRRVRGVSMARNYKHSLTQDMPFLQRHKKNG